ncbi:MAG: asparagine synthetase A [Oligoflexales bacterium]
MKNIPKTWECGADHFQSVLTNEWYKVVSSLFSEVTCTTIDFFRKEGLSPVLLPITCPSISSPMGLGSDSLPVEIELHNEKIYLADSMQFHLEYLLRIQSQGVFYIMPTFRGEDPDATHLNQFFHAEAEIQGGFFDVMQLVNKYVLQLTKNINSKLSCDLNKVGINTEHLDLFINLNGKVPVVAFEDVFNDFKDSEYIEYINSDTPIITRKGELKLIEIFKGPVWLSHPRHNSVPFYQGWSEDRKSALSADLLLGLGEVVGCGERHTSYQDTYESLKSHGVNHEEYDWYLRLKREFPLKTAGFGLGIERFLAWVLKHNDIRDLALFNRLKGIKSAP